MFRLRLLPLSPVSRLPASLARACLCIAFGAATVGCGPATPEAEDVTRLGETTVTVHKGAYDESTAPSGKPLGEVAPAAALEPPAKPVANAAPHPLIGGASGDGALPLATTLATTRSALYVFGRTRAGYV